MLELARRQRFAISEDDYDHEFHYPGRLGFAARTAEESARAVARLAQALPSRGRR